MISADDHLDLQYLPTDLWTKRLPQSLRDRAPHVENRNGGSVWGLRGRGLGALGGNAKSVGAEGDDQRDNAAALYGL